jgi:xylose isomerase-like TIM barrel protein
MMTLTRRDFGKLALSVVPAVLAVPARAQTTRRPNSVINGVNLGTITYSYRSMPDQSVEAMDLGHYVAAGGDPLAFLNRQHARIASFHLKDRTTPANGQKNLPWGTGDTPLAQILQTVKKNGWKMPATIELEYDVPAGSNAVKEVVRCFEFCRHALA